MTRQKKLLIFISLAFTVMVTLLALRGGNRPVCERLPCAVTAFGGERSARDHFGELRAGAVGEAELLPEELWPGGHYPGPRHEGGVFTLAIGDITQTGEPERRLVSPKRFRIRHVYELEGSDLLLHGTFTRTIKAVGAEEDLAVSFQTISDLASEYFRGVDAHFLLRVTRGGRVMWIRGISPFEPESDGSYALNVSRTGAVTVVGMYDGHPRLGVGGSTERLLPRGFAVFAARFSGDGEVDWCGVIGHGWVVFHSVAVADEDRVFVLAQGRRDAQFYREGGVWEIPRDWWFTAEFTACAHPSLE